MFRLSHLSVQITMFFVLMFGRGSLRICKHMPKSLRQISHMFHPTDQDGRLLNIARDAKILNVQVERDYLGKIGKIGEFLKFLRILMIMFPFI